MQASPLLVIGYSHSVLRNPFLRVQPPQHEADHSKTYPGHTAGDRGLVVPDEPAILQEPCEGALDDPALWQYNEPTLFWQLGDYDQLEPQVICRPVFERTLVGRVGKDHFKPRVLLPAELRERGPCTDRIGHVGLVDKIGRASWRERGARSAAAGSSTEHEPRGRAAR